MSRHALTLAAALMLAAPLAAHAVGTEEETPPEPTETTEVCDEGLVWDLATETCLPPEESTNDDSARLRDARELAYDGQYAAALDVLRTIPAQDDSMVLTVTGFATRKAGDFDGGMALYDAALRADPDNLLARSYMGMGLVEAGRVDEAWTQFFEIRARGGTGGWPERALFDAIESGGGTSY